MKRFRIVFSPEAQAQLVALHRYIAEAAAPAVAARYTEAIVSYCESLHTTPHRGMKRDDVRAGLRVTHCRKRCVIAFHAGVDAVSIVGVFDGGQDDETILHDAPDDGEDPAH